MARCLHSPLAGNKEERSSPLLAGQRVKPEVIEEENKSDQVKTVYSTGKLGPPRLSLSLLHGGQSSDDSLKGR